MPKPQNTTLQSYNSKGDKIHSCYYIYPSSQVCKTIKRRENNQFQNTQRNPPYNRTQFFLKKKKASPSQHDSPSAKKG